MSQAKITPEGTILIVDDVPENLKVLRQVLELEGYDILPAPSGEVALKIAPRAKPDLILLDIVMPKIDGFEVCRRLKSDESTADIPIIFITARSDIESIVEGFQIGGVDYIIKPLRHEEVRARVRTHLTIKRLQDGLREANDRLKKANARIEAQKEAAERELQDARQMQMSLMPQKAPPVEGVEIAGKCIPANTVGGDFFDYLSTMDGKIVIALADVSGKGLKSAMNAVLANGMLHEVAKLESSCGKILSTLNTDLYPRMEKHMFTALGLAIIEQDSKTLSWASAGQPEPIVKQAEQVFEFTSDNELPLGMMQNRTYPERELKLQEGSIVIFYTDGIIEAENKAEEMYGTERLKQVITHMSSTMNAEEVIKAILEDVSDFVEDTEQYDDMTVVVVKKL